MPARPARIAPFWLLTAGLAAAMASHTATAWELQGTKTLVAHTRDQQRLTLGTVEFTPRPDGRIAFAVHMDHAKFTDHFLSMKEFKCVEGGGEVSCHVPYPYPNPGTVTPTDLGWLEHHLLFLFKLPKEFGAKLWNGLYYRLERTDAGLVGRPQSIDLNLISAPPAQTDRPPYRPALRDDVAAGVRWIDRIAIE
ncbi:hypothetical protein [Sphaerotilus sp.]|uniref:hypothetical protein n=1 Tax=Sphaerotilus sp. TaxID=2093942 RepID=UPI00286DC733|nr:hypothetical protein [Sphaerotilus sp.]